MAVKTTPTILASGGAARRLWCRHARRISVIAALVVGSVLAASPAEAVLFYETSDPDHNTTAPTGDLADSGWQYQGVWGFLQGTTVGDSYFITAQHARGSPGADFDLGGTTYTTIGKVDSPTSDLTLWQVDGTFDSFAPLYTGNSEAGKNAIIFGRGIHAQGLPVLEDGDGELKGWKWASVDRTMRWGRNELGFVEIRDDDGLLIDELMVAAFDAVGVGKAGVSDEAHVSSGDSGGGLFIRDQGVWKLAGVSSTVQIEFRTTADEENPFRAAIFDIGGLYVEVIEVIENKEEVVIKLVTDTPDDIPSLMFPVRVSDNADWINRSIAATHRWSAGEASAAWGSAASWQGAGVPQIDWIATLANTTTGGGQQAIVETDSTVRQINLFGHAGAMNLTLSPGVSLRANDVINIDGEATVRLQSGAMLAAGGGIDINDGATVELQSGDSSIDGRVVIIGGQLTGSGTVTGKVTNVGIVAPAATVAGLHIRDNYDQRVSGTLRLEFAGLEEGQFSRLTVDGEAKLAGTLELVDADPGLFEMLPGDEFEVLFYTTRHDEFFQFDTITNPDRPGLIYDAQYDNDSLLLTASATLGDANLDGRVDQLDVDVMAGHWKQTVGERGWTAGDFDGNEIVNLIDLVITAENWQAGAPAGAASPAPLDLQAFLAAVPEPHSAALLIAAIPFLLTRRRRAS